MLILIIENRGDIMQKKVKITQNKKIIEKSVCGAKNLIFILKMLVF